MDTEFKKQPREYRMKKILKTILKSLPLSVNLTINSFVLAPIVVLPYMLLFSADFDLHNIGKLLLQTKKDDIVSLWNMVGWLSFFLFIGFDFIKRAFKKEKRGEYFQIPIAQLKNKALNENSKIITHGIKLNDYEYVYFKDSITEDEANQLLRLFQKSKVSCLI